MKKVFVSPKLELCEFVVAARLNGSGLGTGHSNAPDSACSKVASAGSNSCVLPSLANSSIANDACEY